MTDPGDGLEEAIGALREELMAAIGGGTEKVMRLKVEVLA